MASCSCENAKKIPTAEREFLSDQRSTRKMMIGALDVAMTQKLKKREERQLKEKERFDRQWKISAEENAEEPVAGPSGCQPQPEPDISDICLDSSETDSDFDVAVPSSSSSSAPKQMRTSLSNLARECDRYGVSDRSAAAIATAVLQGNLA